MKLSHLENTIEIYSNKEKPVKKLKLSQMQTVSIIGKILLLQAALSVNAINWQTGGWAMQCDFNARDLTNKNNIPSSQCGGLCAGTPGCTHFTWSNYKGGTCWMKKGAVSKSDAFATSDPTMVCGIKETGSVPRPGKLFALNITVDSTYNVPGYSETLFIDKLDFFPVRIPSFTC